MQHLRSPRLLVRGITLLLGGILLVTLSAPGARGPAGNDYVKLKVQPSAAALKPGMSTDVEMQFEPADGIHINADPPVEFSLEPPTPLLLQGKPVMTTDKSTGYLSTTAPVRQKIAVPRTSQTGKIPVKGTVTYFYCSEKEGWCTRARQPVEFTITVVK